MTKCTACDQSSDGQKKCEECELDRALQDFWKDRPMPSDKALFETPPPAEECPICMCSLDTSSSAGGEGNQWYKPCCGKTICAACEYEIAVEDGSDMYPCAFCRVPNPRSDEERLEMVERRIKEYDDANAIHFLANCYRFGDVGVENNDKKAVQLYFEAYLKGHTGAAEEIGLAYLLGRGVNRDRGLSMKWCTLAAVEGSVGARRGLGFMEMELDVGNTCRAMRHLLLAASAGDDESLQDVMQGYKGGHVKKDDLEKALRAHHQARNDMKSDRRDAFMKEVEDRRKRRSGVV